MTDTGSFGTEKRPVILDPSQLIRRVQWAITPVVVVTLDAEIAYTVVSGETDMQWSAHITDSNVTGLIGSSLLEGIGSQVSEPGPPTKQQKADFDFYHYEPRKTDTSTPSTAIHHFVDRGIYHIYTNQGVITFHEDPTFGVQVPFIIDYRPEFAGIDSDEEFGYDAFGVYDPGTRQTLTSYMHDIASHIFPVHPTQLWELLFQELVWHDDIVNTVARNRTWRTMLFLNTPRILSKNKTVKEAKKITIRITLAGATAKQFVKFKLGVHTWRGVKTFSYDQKSKYLLKPNPDKTPISEKFEDATNRKVEQVYPSQQIDFEIETKKFIVTATRKELT